MSSLRITKFGLCDEGYLTARVTHGGRTINVDKKYGSWQQLVPVNGHVVRREVPYFIAEALQAKLPKQSRKRKAERAK